MNNQEKFDENEENPLKEKNNCDEAEFKNKSFKEKLLYLKSNISVEPIFAGLIIPSMLSRLAVQNLNLDKACRVKINYEDAICDALIDKKGNLSILGDQEAEVQKIISSIEAWKSIIQTAIPTVLVILMGAWSDRTGNRKICILAPVLGEFMVCISNLISTIFFNEIPVEATMFFEAFFPAITGGWVMLYLGGFSYISDITDEKSRTFRVGVVNLCLTAGIPIGSALSGILLQLWGYYGIFILSGLINLLTLLYGFYYLKNNTKPNMDLNEKKKPVKFREIIILMKETIVVAFRKRRGIYRKKILMTLLVVALIYGPNHGERIITYLFVRYRLKWDALKYSMYSTYGIITHSMGALFSITVFSKRWGFHDSALCLISIASKLAGSICITLVTNDFQMYMIPLVEILNATTFTSLRSMASKLVGSEEMGKMNSLFSLVETLAALIFDPTYSTMYSKTVGKMSGAVFVFSASMTLPSMGVLLWIVYIGSCRIMSGLYLVTIITQTLKRWILLQHRKETKQKLKESALEAENVLLAVE